MANKTLLVARREYLENVRTKTFWISMLAFPAIFAISIGVAWLMQKTKGTQHYAVLDYTSAKLGATVEKAARAGDFAWSVEKLLRDAGIDRKNFPLLERLGDLEMTPEQEAAAIAQFPAEHRAKLESMLNSAAARYEVVALAQLGVADAPREQQERELTAMVNSGRLYAYFLFDGDPVQELKANLVYVCNNLTDEDLRSWYERAATRVIRKARIAEAKIEPQTARFIQESADFVPRQVDKTTGKTKDVEKEDLANKWAPVAFVYLLWIAIFTAANMLLTNTVEEKSNRVIEVLLSSVSPSQLMSGKIWGIGATGLTIVTSWVLCALVGIQLGTRLVPKLGELNLTAIVGNPLYLTSFLAYFLTGYLLFAALLVAIGSVCNSLKEAQNLMQPVFLLLMIPLFAMVPIVQEPNGLMAKVFTYIPLYTPFAMMNRASGPPATWEYAVTSVMILVSVWLAFKAAGKIFRVGVLMTGNPPKLKEILGWLREK